MRSRSGRALAVGLGALALAVCAGCRARRELRIRSQPPGATVRLDDEVVGEAPLSVEFEHYGVRQVTFYKEGYHTASSRVRLKTPWWSYFPIDLVSEILLPFGWRDQHDLEFAMQPEKGQFTEEELQEVLRRANRLRRAGPAGPQATPSDGGAAPGESGS